MLRIDTHQHFWAFSSEDYGWIDEGMSVLRRDFNPADLRPFLQQCNIAGTVLVEARASLEETKRLLSIAEAMPEALGVVGWVPLDSPTVEVELERFSAHPKFSGVRHAIGAEPDPDYLFGSAFNRGVRSLKRFDLTYDLSFWPPLLERAVQFVDAHPDQKMILDHCAKPYIREGRMEPWREQVQLLAQRDNVFCKLSGLATESNWTDWKGQVQPYLDVVLEAFSPKRLMFGSDWPVCTLAASYGDWYEAVTHWMEPLSDTEKAQIWSGTAVDTYRLKLPPEGLR